MEDNVSSFKWYPSPVPEYVPESKSVIEPDLIIDAKVHPIWKEIKYTSSNWWSPIISKERKELCRKTSIPGVEVRDLAENHPLCGQQGLFAIKKFLMCDVIGEYTGRIVGEEMLKGHYLATLEDLPQEKSLGIDAEKVGNEMRFINSYLNIAFSPNVTMRTTYINTYPHLMIVCTRDIDIGEEILLDYGEAYNKEFLQPKSKIIPESTLSNEELLEELPTI